MRDTAALDLAGMVRCRFAECRGVLDRRGQVSAFVFPGPERSSGGQHERCAEHDAGDDVGHVVDAQRDA